MLIIDLGGGISDFSLIRVSPAGRAKTDRRDDILATGGVHIGGTDFDRRLSMAKAMPELGLGTWSRDGKRQLPQLFYHDLATWHRIHALYNTRTEGELQQIRYDAAPARPGRPVAPDRRPASGPRPGPWRWNRPRST